jgi:GWxTD domain-containing protein
MNRLPLRLVLLLLFLSIGSIPLGAQTLPDLFQKAKAQVKAQAWQDALTTLAQLDAESAKPGNDAARNQLAAPMAFYRGVCEANLDMAEQAEADFATFLREKPGSTIDQTMYSKKAVAAFEAASKEVAFEAASKEVAPGGSLSLFQKFEQFKTPPNTGEKPDDRWADGPVKWIMTAEEKAAWAGLADGAERAAFVETFWERRNTKPGSEDNTARTGFDRRVAFADANCQLDEQQRGSLTDAGMVFILLGPPSWTGRKPILTGEDRSVSDGMSLDQQWFMASRNSVHIDGAQAPEASGAFREIWHYRREALPKGVSASQVNVVFVTKTGYGRSVLLREPATLGALDAARQGRSKN